MLLHFHGGDLTISVRGRSLLNIMQQRQVDLQVEMEGMIGEAGDNSEASHQKKEMLQKRYFELQETIQYIDKCLKHHNGAFVWGPETSFIMPRLFQKIVFQFLLCWQRIRMEELAPGSSLLVIGHLAAIWVTDIQSDKIDSHLELSSDSEGDEEVSVSLFD